MPGANAPSVAEGTVLLMLAALRRLPALDRGVRHGSGWPADPELGETIRDIGGCTVGLVGYGNIAQRVSDIVTAMRATVLHTSTRDDGRPWRQLSDLLAAIDIVSLHLPLTADTIHLLDRDAMAQMKPNAVLVNTSRGGVIDRGRTRRGAARRAVGGCGTGCFRSRAGRACLRLENVVVTPHVTWYTADTMRRYLTETVANCRRLRDGQSLAHIVNQPTGG